ncbi:MAG: hypothetical protein HGA23_06645 [Bacteroidales bacterium]|nr:hypothetical protein [Bacteroidales bacterium]
MKRIYKNLSLLAILIAAISMTGLSQNAWINEFHYDNVSTDAGEFIEVVLENPGNYSLADFSVVLYNGSGGTSYDTKTLDQFTAGAVSGNYSLYYFNYPVNGIQNGAPDGMALCFLGSVISGQWLSYEGAFTATNGPVAGLLSVDIVVLETGTTPIGQSLQLTGFGAGYSEFTWQPPAVATPGQLNTGQEFPLPVPELPVANWALLFGGLLIAGYTFLMIRKRV